jgi:hypothetical protein
LPRKPINTKTGMKKMDVILGSLKAIAARKKLEGLIQIFSLPLKKGNNYDLGYPRNYSVSLIKITPNKFSQLK